MEIAGAQWCARFPGSNSLDDLEPEFQTAARYFIGALKDAGAIVTVAATYRPPERAYLMHWCCLVAGYRDREQIFHQIGPGHVPPMAGVDIDWSCGGNPGAAILSARAMRQGFGIIYPAACVSRHTERDAIDMDIAFQGPITVRDADGTPRQVAAQADLWPIGAGYGVHKLAGDPPHWSKDGR